ncbi:MAG: DUF1385 domain-containing protein [Actinomycetota bacterium]
MSQSGNGASADPVLGAHGNGAGREPLLRLGGMALRNGLLIHGPRAWAAAARTRDGRIEVSSGPKPAFSQGRLGSTPLLRGPLRLAEAFAVVPLARRRLPAARLPIEDPRVLVVGIVTAAVSGAIRRLGRPDVSRGRAGVREGTIALLGVLPAAAALRDRDLAAYHGVEHKAIGAYERRSLDPADAPKEHERCGSNLIAPLLVLSVAGQLLAERLFSHPGPLVRAVVGIGSVSGAVELFAYAERRPESPLGRGIHGVGHQIQRLFSTREPTPEQLEVGSAALREVLRAEAELAANVQPPGGAADTL